MLTTAYTLLADGREYREPGTEYCAARRQDHALRRAMELLERHGYRVSLEAAA